MIWHLWHFWLLVIFIVIMLTGIPVGYGMGALTVISLPSVRGRPVYDSTEAVLGH